mgnify:FL=1
MNVITIRLALLIFFWMQGLIAFGQYKFAIVNDLEPELSEQWTLDAIKENRITKVSVTIRSFSYKLFKKRKKVDVLYYNASTNEIRFRKIDVSPSPDKGGYLISHFNDITLHYDSSDKIVSRMERLSDSGKTMLMPEDATEIQYENGKIVREIRRGPESTTTFEYRYFRDSVHVVYSSASSSSDQGIVKRQYLNRKGQVMMEVDNKLGRLDTVFYTYHGDVLSDKVHSREDALDFTYNDKGKITSRCQKINGESRCSYITYSFRDNMEFREQVSGKDITTTVIQYDPHGLMLKKTVRLNGKVIIKYKYTYS